MRKTKWFLLAVLVLIIGCEKNNHEQIQEQERIPVKLAQVERKNLSKPIRSTGFLAANEESKLSFKIGGFIDTLTVNEGDRVEKGEMMASLKLNEIESMVHQAKSAFEKANRDLQRVQNLYRDSVATLEQIQDAQTGMEIAQSQYQIAQFNLEHSKIIAPSNGKVLKILVERNELIAPGYPVFLFGYGRRDWVLKVGLTDRDVVRCKYGDTAHIEFDAYPNKTFSARVQEIAGAPDPMSGLFEIKLKVEPASISLMTGFIGRVTIFPSDQSMVTVIPMIALVNGDNHQGSVYSIKDNVAEKREVAIAFLLDDQVALKDTLSGIDYIVTEGASYLKPGVHVEIVAE